MTTIYKYALRCITENENKTVWSETPPTACPIHTDHIISEPSIRVIDLRSPNEIQIKEETVPTGGNFRAICKKITIAPSEKKNTDFIWPFPITALGIKFVTTAENEGDKLELIAGPDTIVGMIGTNISSGTNEIVINTPVWDLLYIGYNIKLSNGVNTENLGYIIEKDNATKTVRTSNSTVNSYLSANTSVMVSVYIVEDFTIGKAGDWSIGDNKIGGSYVDKNKVVRFVYHNQTIQPKTFYALFSYLY